MKVETTIASAGLQEATDEQLFLHVQEFARIQNQGGKATDVQEQFVNRAVQLLMERYHDKLTKHIAIKVGNPDDADDIVMTAWESMWEKAEQFREDSSFKTWLYRIADYKMLDHLKKEKKAKGNVSYDKLSTEQQEKLLNKPPFGQSPDHIVCSSIDYEEKKVKAALLLQGLEEPLKAIFVLREGHEMSYREIGEFLLKQGLTLELLTTTQVHHRYEKAFGLLSKAAAR